jgi:hypothetical protein
MIVVLVFSQNTLSNQDLDVYFLGKQDDKASSNIVSPTLLIALLTAKCSAIDQGENLSELVFILDNSPR